MNIQGGEYLGEIVVNAGFAHISWLFRLQV